VLLVSSGMYSCIAKSTGSQAVPVSEQEEEGVVPPKLPFEKEAASSYCPLNECLPPNDEDCLSLPGPKLSEKGSDACHSAWRWQSPSNCWSACSSWFNLNWRIRERSL
jgi:hypothetical protein